MKPTYSPDDVRQRINAGIKASGSLRKWCKTNGLNPGNVSRFLNKRKLFPQQSILAALGIGEAQRYEVRRYQRA